MSAVIENNCFFLTSSTDKYNLPDETINEIGFWGRSNVGKSSLLNSITKSKLARISKTPGRTTSLNFFEIKKKIRLVDFPGYGYAKRSKSEIYSWNKLILDYLDIRKTMICIFLLIDSRRGLKEIDFEAMNLLESMGNRFFIVLTKSDKINKNDRDKCYTQIEKKIKNCLTANQRIFFTSSKKNEGIQELTNVILESM